MGNCNLKEQTSLCTERFDVVPSGSCLGFPRQCNLGLGRLGENNSDTFWPNSSSPIWLSMDGLEEKKAQTGKVTGDPPRIASALIDCSQPRVSDKDGPTMKVPSALEPSGWKRTAEAARSPSVKPLTAHPETMASCVASSTQAERQRQGPSPHASPAILLEPRLRQLPQIPTRRIDGDRKIGIFPPLIAEILRGGGEVQPIEPCCRLSPSLRSAANA